MHILPFPFTLRQLQYFCAVVDAGSFRGAAERCAVSQPALSMQLQELETQLGQVLVERHRGGARPTPAGAALLPLARATLLAAGGLHQGALAAGDPMVRSLRLGVLPTIAPYLLPDLDAALRVAWPQLEIVWQEDRTQALVGQVESGALDGALVAAEAELGALETQALGRDPFVLAVRGDHALGQSDGPVPLAVLQEGPVLLLEDGHCFGQEAALLCAMVGARQARDLRATSLTTLVQMAAAGRGITVLPTLAVEVENRRGSLVTRSFEAPGAWRTLVLAWRRGSGLEATMAGMAEVGRKVLGGG